MPNQVTGRMLAIGQTVQIPSKTGGDPFLNVNFCLMQLLMTPTRVNVVNMRISYRWRSAVTSVPNSTTSA